MTLNKFPQNIQHCVMSPAVSPEFHRNQAVVKDMEYTLPVLGVKSTGVTVFLAPSVVGRDSREALRVNIMGSGGSLCIAFTHSSAAHPSSRLAMSP